MRSTLAGREDGIIDALLEVFRVFKVLPEEDQTSTGSTEGFVAGIRSVLATKELTEFQSTHVVVVTTSQYWNGSFNSCAATSPLVCAISAISHAPSFSAVFFSVA
jgi:hypothetical protein